jgi:hypothetical protein
MHFCIPPNLRSFGLYYGEWMTPTNSMMTKMMPTLSGRISLTSKMSNLKGDPYFSFFSEKWAILTFWENGQSNEMHRKAKNFNIIRWDTPCH